jgi:hypothetical protein
MLTGVPQGSTQGTLCATYNNLDSVKALFEANKGEIAGVILEPIVGNSGYIEPTKEFLQGLGDITSQEGAVLCFDEVCCRGLFSAHPFVCWCTCSEHSHSCFVLSSHGARSHGANARGLGRSVPVPHRS